MRGGSIPLFLWGTGLLVLLAVNAVWTHSGIQAGMFAFAVAAVWGTALAVSIRHPEALRRGAPIRSPAPEAAPQTSLAAMVLGVAIGAMLFGVVFGRFLVYVGAGVWLLAAGRLAVEVRAQRRSVREEPDR
ncbi:MAG: hypothetical protein ACJ764_05485 [Solirubrobacteraceae bacterium]